LAYAIECAEDAFVHALKKNIDKEVERCVVGRLSKKDTAADDESFDLIESAAVQNSVAQSLSANICGDAPSG
jgi:hypothetical protein